MSFTFKAILSRTTTDIIKSKFRSDNYSELVLDVYMRPTEFARILEEYGEKEFKITISKKKQ